jgi:hypothetical protein
MAKTFKSWDVDQPVLLPPSVQELVPAGHLAHFVRDLVRESLDVSAILTPYTEDRGFPPYDPTMMTAPCCMRTAKGSTRRDGLRRRVRSGWTSWP